MKTGCQSMIGKIESIMLKRPENSFVSQENLQDNYEKYNYLGCPDYEKVLSEYDQFENLIKRYVPNIHYLPFDEKAGLDSIYTHDSFKVTKKGAVYFPMGKELRAGEPFAAEAHLKKIGIPTLGRIEEPGKMEGGDVLWLDERTVAIGRGYRTNDEGIAQFKKLTEGLIDEYIIVPLPHADGEACCLHLMSIISLADIDKAVVYSRYMPVIFRQYLLERGMTLVECDDDEYEHLGSNLLALCPGTVVMIDGCPKTKKRLEKIGIEVLIYPGYDLSYRGTGGPTCLTAPLVRL
ncbi:MAG: dimethylarginine dimethylaminohydrolase family protein [Lachnospiraceae bacterium]